MRRLALALLIFLWGYEVSLAAGYNGTVHFGPGGAPIGFATMMAAPGTSITGSTSETVLANIRIPANMLGPNARIIVRTFWNFTSTNGTKTCKVYLNSSAAAGGTAYLSNAAASGSLSAQFETNIVANGATNAQVGGLPTGTQGASTSAALPSGTIDTTADSYIVISATLASGSDTATLVAVQVELIP